MIIKRIQSLITGNIKESIQQGSIDRKKTRHELDETDVTEKIFMDEASGSSAELNEIVKHGSSEVNRQKFKKTVRGGVWDIVKRSLGNPNDDMVDEITERIVEAAEVDPYYQKIFDKNDK